MWWQTGREAVDGGAQNFLRSGAHGTARCPEMDGFEATREIRRREHPERRNVIIAVTANAIKGDAKKCLDAGMDGYVTKPVTAEGLKDVLEESVLLNPTEDAAVVQDFA